VECRTVAGYIASARLVGDPSAEWVGVKRQSHTLKAALLFGGLLSLLVLGARQGLMNTQTVATGTDFTSTTHATRYSWPRTIEAMGGLGQMTAKDAAANPMADLFANVGSTPGPPPGPVTVWHYAPNGNFDSSGTYTPAADGFNLADVSSLDLVNSLPSGVKGLVWIGQCGGATTTFTSAISPFIGNPKVFGFYLMDGPDPTGPMESALPRSQPQSRSRLDPCQRSRCQDVYRAYEHGQFQ